MIALDTETTGLDLRHGAKPFLVTICDEEGENTYWEWPVDPLTRQPIVDEDDLKEIQEEIDNTDEIILQNPKFDVAALQTVYRGRLRWDWGKTRDTLLAGHLLASNAPHDLTTMVLIYLGVNVQPFEDEIHEAVDEAHRIAKRDFPDWRIAKKGLPEMPSAKEKVWKNDMWLPAALAKEQPTVERQLSADFCADYANSDSATTIALYLKMRELMEERGLLKIYEDRLKILPVVYEMEGHSITYNKPRLEKLRTIYRKESAKASKVCLDIAKKYDYELELPKSGTNNSLHTFIFDCLQLEPVKRSKKTKKPSLDSDCMDTYLSNLPEGSEDLAFVTALMSKRKRDTSLNYMDSYEKFGIPWESIAQKMSRPLGNPKCLKVGGPNSQKKEWYRLYPSLNPTGTDTLRWSSSNPNEQQISKKSLDGFNLRYCFGPTPGREWWSLDYDNLELRLAAYQAKEPAMVALFEKPDDPPFFGSYHLLVCSILHPKDWKKCLRDNVSFKDVHPINYGKTKNGNFAVQYGALAWSGTADRAYGIPGAQALVENRFRKIGKLNQYWIDHAKKHGFVATLPDKEVDPTKGYPLLAGRTKWGKLRETTPLNYNIQGTACHIMCRAMVKVQNYLNTLGSEYKMIMNVHDEIVLDFPKGRKKNLPKVRRIRRIMESIGDCVNVPLTCGIDYHPNNWSEGVTI